MALKENPWRFAFKRFDPESNLVYFGHRYYDLSLGRWISPGPLSYASGPNLYAYVYNDPYRYMDPDGRFAFALAIPVLAGTFGVGAATFSFIAVETIASTCAIILLSYASMKQIKAMISISTDIRSYGNGIPS